MKAKDILDALDTVRRVEPQDLELEVVFEEKDVWSAYHMSPGVSTRFQAGKEPVICVRLP